MRKLLSLYKKHSFLFLKILTFMAIVLLVCASLRRGWIHDEMECLKSSWFIAQGMEPYKDFFQHHHPLFYYLLSPFALFAGETGFLFISRIVSLCFCLVTLFYTYKLGKLLFSSLIGFLSVVLCMSWNIFAESGFEVRPDTSQIACATAGTFFFFCFLRKRKKKYLVLSAFLYSLSFLLLQKSFIFPFFACLVLAYEWSQKRIVIKDIGVWIVVYAIPLLSYWIFLLMKGDFYHYWVCNYLFNAEMAKKFTWIRFSRAFINKVFLPNSMLWFFFLVGFLESKKNYIIALIAFLSMSIIAMRVDGPHYWIIALPYISIIAAYALRVIFKNNTHLLVVFSLFSLFPTFKMWFGNISFGNQKQIEILAYFRSLSKPQDTCFGDSFVCSFRKSPDFFWHGDFEGDRSIYNLFLPYHALNSKDILLRSPLLVQRAKLSDDSNYNMILSNNYKIINKDFGLFILKKER